MISLNNVTLGVTQINDEQAMICHVAACVFGGPGPADIEVATLVGACSVPTPVAECSDRTPEGASLVHRAVHLETQGVELAGDCLDSPSLVEASLDLEAAAVAAEALASAKVAAWAKDNPRVAYLEEEEASGKARHLVVCSDNQQVGNAKNHPKLVPNPWWLMFLVRNDWFNGEYNGIEINPRMVA